MKTWRWHVRENWYTYEVAKIIGETHPMIPSAEPLDRPGPVTRWRLARKARRIWGVP